MCNAGFAFRQWPVSSFRLTDSYTPKWREHFPRTKQTFPDLVWSLYSYGVTNDQLGHLTRNERKFPFIANNLLHLRPPLPEKSQLRYLSTRSFVRSFVRYIDLSKWLSKLWSKRKQQDFRRTKLELKRFKWFQIIVPKPSIPSVPSCWGWSCWSKCPADGIPCLGHELDGFYFGRVQITKQWYPSPVPGRNKGKVSSSRIVAQIYTW